MTPNREAITLPGVLTWLGLRPTPLRRSFDRWEIAARWVAILTVVGAVVVGSYVSTTVGDRVGSTAERQAQVLRPTTATLLEDTAAVAGPPADPGSRMRATAAWTTPDGRRLDGPISLPTAAEKGEQVQVWLDADGNPTTPPASNFEVSLTAVVAGLTAAALTILTALGWLVLVRRLLESPAQRYWEHAWSAFDELGDRPSH